MTKNLEELKIEELQQTVSILVRENIDSHKKIKELTQELDAALEEAEIQSTNAKLHEVRFNEPKFELMEATSELKSLNSKMQELKRLGKDFRKKTISVLERFTKKLPSVELIHHFEDDEVEERVKPIDVYRLAEYEGFIRTLTEEIEKVTSTIDELSKKEVVKGIDLSTFTRTDENTKTAKEAILSYAEFKGGLDLKEQFIKANTLMNSALDIWFGIYYHESFKNMSVAKAKAYMAPYYRAERSVIKSLRDAKRKEYDWRIHQQ